MFGKKIYICLVLCFLFTMPCYALALDWNDNEWREGGCPQDIEGTWVAESESPYSGQEIEFRQDSTLLIVRSGRDLVLPVKREPWDFLVLPIIRPIKIK